MTGSEALACAFVQASGLAAGENGRAAEQEACFGVVARVVRVGAFDGRAEVDPFADPGVVIGVVVKVEIAKVVYGELAAEVAQEWEEDEGRRLMVLEHATARAAT